MAQRIHYIENLVAHSLLAIYYLSAAPSVASLPAENIAKLLKEP
jgi:hypothetical protein